jgi:predicted nucleic acid-binding protein
VTVIDTSVWIDWFRDSTTAQTAWLERSVPREILLLDIVLFEVLQAARDERHAANVERRLGRFTTAQATDVALAIAAARHSRTLRALGITIRKSVDLLIGTFCIAHGHELVHADRDFEPMAKHLGLRVAVGPDSVH